MAEPAAWVKARRTNIFSQGGMAAKVNRVRSGVGEETHILAAKVEAAGVETCRKSALIVEGGAMRGAWAAGVLAYLQESGRHYDLVYAASS